MVRTQDFHSCNRGSIPRSTTKHQIPNNINHCPRGNFFVQGERIVILSVAKDPIPAGDQQEKCHSELDSESKKPQHP
jgi:hypothetical protein